MRRRAYLRTVWRMTPSLAHPDHWVGAHPQGLLVANPLRLEFQFTRTWSERYNDFNT